MNYQPMMSSPATICAPCPPPRLLELTTTALQRLGVPLEKRGHVLLDARWLLEWAITCRFPEAAERLLEENRGRLMALVLVRDATPERPDYQYEILIPTPTPPAL